MRLAEQADPQLRGPGQQTWLRRLDAETPNMRAAFDTAVRIGDAELALRLANALTWYWFLRGRRGQARRTLTAALEVPGPAPAAARARATAWRAAITLQSGAFTGTIAEHLAALAPYADVDDPAGRARAEWFLGTSLYGIGDLTPSEDLVDRALTSARLLGDRWLTAAALSSRAFQAKLHGDFAALRRDGEQSLAVFTELGDQWGRLQAMVPLATLAEIEGNYETATGLYQAGLRVAEELQLWPEVSFQLTGAGRIAILTGDLERAHDLHERARKLSIQQSDRFGEQFAVVGLALIARRKGELDTAESHIEHVLELHRQRGYESALPALLLAELGFIAEQRGDAESAWRLHVQGLTTAQATGDPRAIALALEGMAGAQTLAGHPRRAARLLGAAVAARASAGAPLPPAERGDVNRITTRLRAELGNEDFAVEHLRGTELQPVEHLPTSPDELRLPT
jgi:tetratricopeptide (TPR) repeat protein